MKTLLLLATTILLTSCGVSEQLNKNCGSDIRMGCNFVFGTKDADQDEQIVNNTRKNSEQDVKIQQLEASISTIIANIQTLSMDTKNLLDANSATVTTINSLQGIVNAHTTQLLQMSSIQNKTIVDLKDPCGDGLGYDEILMKTQDGKFVAYFEDGGKRFLSVLENGNYRTTDQSKCYFTVNNGVITNEHY
jgi:hypothetical protein